MPLKDLFRGGDDGGGGRSERGGGGGKQDNKFMSKMVRVLQNNSKRDKALSLGADRPYFNPEEHISEKREWSRRYTQSTVRRGGAGGGSGSGSGGTGGSDRLFEHFAVVGLPPTMNIRAVASDIKTFQRVNRESGSGGAAAAIGLHITTDTPREERQRQYGLKGPALQAEVLCTYPPPALPADLEHHLAAFCFPHGVRPELLERTPSMSALNEVIYSQPYQTHDDHSFVFLMKVADPGSVTPKTLYGVCCYVRELVHRPPSMAKEAFPGCNAPLSRYLVVAPRCYCLLTHYPFFALHFRVLQTILGLERLERMTSFAAELAGLDRQLSPPTSSSLPASSARAASSSSIGPADSVATEEREASSHQGSSAALAPEAGAAAAAADEEGEGSASSSSRRWTEGSGATAPDEQQQQQRQQQAVGELASTLQRLMLEEQQQEQQQQHRPSRLSQVSPHCPGLALVPAAEDALLPTAAAAATAGSSPDAARPPAAAAAAAAAGFEADCDADTPVARSSASTSAAAAAAVGATPFFTPAGTSSTPGRGITPQQQQQQQVNGGQQLALPAAAAAAAAGGSLEPTSAAAAAAALHPTTNSTRRVLDGSLAAAADGAGAGAQQTNDTGSSRGGSSQSSGRRGEQQRQQEQEQQQEQQQDKESDDDSENSSSSSSDAGSYLTASSSVALLLQQQQQDASPAAAALLAARLAQQAQHVRSISGTSLGGVSTAASSPSPAAPNGMAAAADAQQRQQQEEQQPLIELDMPLQQRQQQQEQQPLIDLEEHQQQQHAPLLVLDETPVKAHQQRAPQQWQQQQQHQQPPNEQQQQAGSGVGVQIVTCSFSSTPAAAAAAVAAMMARADTPPRADLLGGTPLASRSSRRLQQQVAEGSSSSERSPAGGASPASSRRWQPQRGQQQQAEFSQQLQQQQGQQQQGEEQHEVVRVTASNLDMSRPMRSTDLLAVYYGSVVPRPGQVFEFQPDPGLQTISFERPDLVEAVKELGLRPNAASLPDIDAAQNLGGWAVAALCRSMSLDNILTFLTAALLERQIVVFCPNAGLLSGIVLSLVPLLLPFHWQCLLLPVLPAAEGRLEIMEAPVPFVLGVLYKTPEVRAKCGGLVRVNVYKDKIKNATLPPLPQQQVLHDALAGTYAELRKIGVTRTATTRPVHMISDAQQVLAECFLSTLQKYLKGLMADLRAYCITDVSASLERTSVLLKDSFVDSFPPRDRPFIRQFGETQMFSVYTDAVLG